MESTENEELLGKEKISKLLIKYSIPCIIALLVSALYNIVDQIFIGQGVGYLGNAATNVVYPYTVIALGCALLIGDGASALFSLSLGRKDYKSSNKTFGTALITAIVISIILTVLGFIFINTILNFFGVTTNTYQYAIEYMKIILIGLPFYIIANSINSLIRADGSPKYAMISTLAGAILNIILDPIAIFVLGWGVKGAATATIIGQIVSFILAIIYFIKPKNFKLSKETFKFDFNILKKEVKLGITSFITQISMVVIMAVMNNLIVEYGELSKYGADIPLSVTGIVMKVFGIIISLAIGLAAGSQPIVGYNFGAGNFDRVKKTYKYIILTGIVIGVIATIIFEFFPQFIINIFGSENDLYNEYARLCFRIFLGSTILTCVVKSSSIFLQALGKSVKSMIISLARDIIFSLPAMIIFAYFGGVVGMLWAPIVADCFCTIIVIIFIRQEFKKFDALKEKTERKTKIELSESVSSNTSNKEKHFVITISREFGSGGRYIGKLLAEKLGINFYDDELITLTANQSGLSENYIKEFSEKKKAGNYAKNNDDRMFIAESKVIHDLAEKESCVIVGRCADYILQDIKDKINLINIFIYNNEKEKVKRAIE